MSLIYEPRGKAREYSPLALNIFSGCPHGCIYCFGPNVLKKKDYFQSIQPKPNLLNLLEKELTKSAPKNQVLLSFIGDPYNKHANGITALVLYLLLRFKTPVAILTKAPANAIADVDLFKKFGPNLKIGSSLTFFSENKSVKFEPFAPLPSSRMAALDLLHGKGIRTWASLEPVIDPDESLKIIDFTSPFIDEYKIGKINHMPDLEKDIDWNKFTLKAIEKLRAANKPFYIKHSLQSPKIESYLRPEERNPDLHALKWQDV
jgi:DNA repair photolyase